MSTTKLIAMPVQYYRYGVGMFEFVFDTFLKLIMMAIFCTVICMKMCPNFYLHPYWWLFANFTKLDVDPRWDDDAYPMSYWRMKVQWCKLVET